MEFTYYVYAYLDPRKPGKFIYGNYCFEFEPFYIGKGKGQRLMKHVDFIKLRDMDVHNNQYKYNIIKQILGAGLEPIIVKVEEGLTNLTSLNLEKLIIESIGLRINGNGSLTNLTIGGTGGDTFTNNPRKEEIRKLHSNATVGEKNPMYGLSLQERPSHKAKGENHWNRGRKATDETKGKMSKARIGAKNSRTKKISQYDLAGNLVKVYDSLYEAINGTGFTKNLLRSCKNNHLTAHGYKWVYTDQKQND
jgi:hypothetical protein